MSSTAIRSEDVTTDPRVGQVDMKLEVITIPVSDVDRAEAAHGEHEKRTGVRDQNWPDWYAEYMRREQSGQELPR